MSTLQSQENELRYLKRQNLKQEQKMIGNWYRDIIRSYGVDVIYQKLDTSVVENFNGIVDRNFALQRAYGQIYDPDYSCSADMVSYIEIDQDMFTMQKFGINPNTDANFYFDCTDFACALATKLGQYEEYKIDETEVVCEVPECNGTIISAYEPVEEEKIDPTPSSDDFIPIIQTSIKVIYDYVTKLNGASEALSQTYPDFQSQSIESAEKPPVELIQDIFTAMNYMLDFLVQSTQNGRFTSKSMAILKYYFKSKNEMTKIDEILDDYKIQIQDDDAKFKVLADAVEKVYGFALTNAKFPANDGSGKVVVSLPEGERTLVLTSYLSDDIFPYRLGLGAAENYSCGIMSGKLSVEINGYELGKEQTVVCDPYEHGDFKIEFPSNDYIYRSLAHKICNDDYLQTLIYLTFKVDKVVTGKRADGTDIEKFILHGKVHGSVLFYNINKIGKFLDKIHPEVGDRIVVDFPDEANREQYEITDCFDKQLSPDGISPLLGTYIWKCKARRYIHSHDNVEMTEKDKQLKEKKKFERAIDNEVMKQISHYEDGEDAAYGGYDPVEEFHEQHDVDQKKHTKLEYLSENELIDIHVFSCGTKICTNGYDLFFIDSNENATKLTLSETPYIVHDTAFDGGLRFLKASADTLVFVNIAGESFKLAEDEEATQKEVELCLNSLFDRAVDPGKTNKEPGNFYIFKESKTVLWSTADHLFCKLASNGRLYHLV